MIRDTKSMLLPPIRQVQGHRLLSNELLLRRLMYPILYLSLFEIDLWKHHNNFVIKSWIIMWINLFLELVNFEIFINSTILNFFCNLANSPFFYINNCNFFYFHRVAFFNLPISIFIIIWQFCSFFLEFFKNLSTLCFFLEIYNFEKSLELDNFAIVFVVGKICKFFEIIRVSNFLFCNVSFFKIDNFAILSD